EHYSQRRLRSRRGPHLSYRLAQPRGAQGAALVEQRQLLPRRGAEALHAQPERRSRCRQQGQPRRQRQQDALAVAERLAEDRAVAPAAAGDKAGLGSDSVSGRKPSSETGRRASQRRASFPSSTSARRERTDMAAASAQKRVGPAPARAGRSSALRQAAIVA